MQKTQLAGHGLQFEGAAFEMVGGQPQRVRWQGTGGTGFALCSCGEASPVLTSGGARKRWHRDHKVAVEAACPIGRSAPSPAR